MHSIIRRLLRSGASLPVIMLMALAATFAGVSQTFAAPPASTCTLVGTTRTCELWAKAGTLNLGVSGATSIPFWGYSDSAAGPAQLPGPALIANQGESLVVVLHNTLNEPSSLNFLGQDMAPDLTGAAASGTVTYTLNLANPGTFLYEAGLTANGARQVAMGMYGAFVVRPATAGQAYDSPISAYNDEALLVLSEIDPNLNAAPTTFMMQNFSPRYWLMNGKVYPNTDPISTSAGNRVLLRYINAGVQERSIGLLGLRETFISDDGIPLSYPYTVIAETIGAGQTMDAITTIPATATTGTRYVLYNTANLNRNASSRTSGVLNTGGMLTFIQVASGTPVGDTAGPVTSGLSLTPAVTNGSVAVAVNATVSDASAGASGVAAAEYFIDTVGAVGTGFPMNGTFGGQTVAVDASISPAQLAALAGGTHTIYVRGRDGAGNWGQVVSAIMTLDTLGPTTSGLSLTPANSNGSAAVVIQATGSDVATGNANISAAEYSIDGGAALPMTVANAAPLSSLTASIPAATVAGLSEGAHSVTVRSQDSFGNWGAATTVTLTIDKTGPVASAISATPNPSNAAIGFNSNTNAVQVQATLTDSVSTIAAAEAFIDNASGQPGSGYQLYPVDGVFNTQTEAGYVNIPLGAISTLANGNHSIYVRGRDALGNWGVLANITFVVDKTAPTISSVTAPFGPTAATTNLALSVVASDANTGGSNITAAEYFMGADPGIGKATPLTGGLGSPSVTATASINVSNMPAASYTISVRVRDAAGNWSAVASLPLDIVFANSFNSTSSPYGWTSQTGTAARIAVSGAANLKDSGTNGMAVNVASAASGYLTQNHATALSSYRARFYVNPNGATLGTASPIIFSAMSGTTTAVSVQMRLNGGNYQVRAGANNNGTMVYTSWYSISGATAVELVWVKGSSTSFQFYTAGTLRQTLTAINSNAYTISATRLGLSSGVTSAMNGSTIYLDGLVITRTSPIGQ